MKKTIRAAAGLLAAAVLLCGIGFAEPQISARAAMVCEDSGRVFYEKNADEKCPIASTTKIMTGLLICEECDLGEEVAVPREAVGVEGSSLYLREGEILTVEALLYGLMLQSGNDAAVALAIACDGDEETFVLRMNDRAEALGLSNTHYGNPHGLDSEENYSTARDLARLTAFALQNPLFAKVVATKNYTVGERQLTNHNKLLWRYEGAVGVKTGYTKRAGRILVSAARRNGRSCIAVTICDPDDWNDHARLLDYAFTQTEKEEPLWKNDCKRSSPATVSPPGGKRRHS